MYSFVNRNYLIKMDLSLLTAVSPIDGRYRSKTKELTHYFSEFALIKYRVYIEIEYFIALCEIPLPAVKTIDDAHLLIEKGVHPHDHIGSCDTFNEVELLPIDADYKKLCNSHVSDKEYERTQLVWNRFSMTLVYN